MERELLLEELKKHPRYLDRLGIYLPRRPQVLEWAAQQYESPEDIPDVEGELEPWLTTGKRGLQHAEGSRYWAAMSTKLGTEVGLVDEATFEFDVKAHFPGLYFSSSQMWVQGDLIYVTIGDIITLPLKGTDEALMITR